MPRATRSSARTSAKKSQPKEEVVKEPTPVQSDASDADETMQDTSAETNGVQETTENVDQAMKEEQPAAEVEPSSEKMEDDPMTEENTEVEKTDGKESNKKDKEDEKEKKRVEKEKEKKQEEKEKEKKQEEKEKEKKQEEKEKDKKQEEKEKRQEDKEKKQDEKEKKQDEKEKKREEKEKKREEKEKKQDENVEKQDVKEEKQDDPMEKEEEKKDEEPEVFIDQDRRSLMKMPTKFHPKLPELEKYWKPAKDDPTDFTGWTYLLQYVDQGEEVDAAVEVYDSFLERYPFCYGYWKKYADYLKKRSTAEEADKVFERGLQAIELSVDLWIHYVTYVKSSCEDHADGEDRIRVAFERAVSSCGLEFRSNKLWDMFIKWEGEKSPRNVMKLYDRLLLIPTAQYTTLMQSFKEFVNDNNPKNFLDVDEFIGFRTEVVKELRAAQGLDPEVPSATAGDTPPGDDAPPGDLVKEEAASDEETKGIREKLIANRAKVFEKLETEVKKRLHFEEALKRPYFHVKPLEKGQLKTWREYLDFEIKEGNADRIRVLFERCFIACALYEEFWLKYIDYLRSQKAADDVVSAVFERTCRVHLKRKLSINLQWSLFEETTGNFDKAMEVLDHLEGNFGLSLAIAMRKISLARRAKKMHEVEALFHNYIEKLIKKGDRAQADAVVIKLARFVDKVLKDRSKTREIMEKAIESSPGNPRMYMYMIDFFAEEGPERTPEILAVFEKAEKSELPNDIKLMFMHRKMEYMEDFGDQIIEAEKAFEDYASFVKKAKEDRKRGHDDGYEYDATGAKKAKTDATSSSISVRASTGATGPYQYGSYSQPAGSTSAAQYNQAYPYSYGTAYQQPQQGAWNYGGAAAAAAAAAAAGGQYAGYTSQQGWQNGYSYYGQR